MKNNEEKANAVIVTPENTGVVDQTSPIVVKAYDDSTLEGDTANCPIPSGMINKEPVINLDDVPESIKGVEVISMPMYDFDKMQNHAMANSNDIITTDDIEFIPDEASMEKRGFNLTLSNPVSYFKILSKFRSPGPSYWFFQRLVEYLNCAGFRVANKKTFKRFLRDIKTHNGDFSNYDVMYKITSKGRTRKSFKKLNKFYKNEHTSVMILDNGKCYNFTVVLSQLIDSFRTRELKVNSIYYDMNKLGRRKSGKLLKLIEKYINKCPETGDVPEEYNPEEDDGIYLRDYYFENEASVIFKNV